jgi:hypothetical protein
VSSVARLRYELANRAQTYARTRSLPHCLSYGETPVVCFEAFGESLHGNFHPASYKAIRANSEWCQRLDKVHTTAKRILPSADRITWRELDSCMSSDALLMNVFCHPGVLRSARVATTLGVEMRPVPRFGFRPRVPLENNRFDRTEVDMRMQDLLVEAKLTESDFQRARRASLLRYRDFLKVFDSDRLPQAGDYYKSYQLIRNVLAAYASQSSFCVLLDARRPDLIEAWYAVMKCVKVIDLRTACKVLTWQELTQVLPASLQAFLAAKYGIEYVGYRRVDNAQLRRCRAPS